jgi:hypothetical protein
MTHCFLDFVPLRVDGDFLTEAACWLDRTWTVVAMGCACGYRHRLVDAADLGVEVSCFYGVMSLSDEALTRLTAELDSSPHAVQMVPALLDIQEPAEATTSLRVPASV